ncbi:hypothetical protein [Okeania sp. KiyG1]|nr:hypothetical protein [Okeania sp. KiyG1]
MIINHAQIQRSLSLQSHNYWTIVKLNINNRQTQRSLSLQSNNY